MDMNFDLNALDVAVFVVDVIAGPDFRFAGMNAAAERETGCTSSRVEGRSFSDCLGVALAETLTERYATVVRTGKALQFEEHASLVESGQWYRTTLSPCLDPVSGAVTRIVAVSQNITVVKRLQLEMKAAAFTDPLTGLANRRAFDQAVTNASEEAVYSAKGFSLAVIDLDGLKRINDTRGHRFGDTVICCVGSALRNGTTGQEVVARVGGDEFYLLLREPTRAGLDARLADLRAKIEGQSRIENYDEPIRLSVGGAVWRPGDDAYEILAAADAAMYREKGARSLNDLVKRHGSVKRGVRPA